MADSVSSTPATSSRQVITAATTKPPLWTDASEAAKTMALLHAQHRQSGQRFRTITYNGGLIFISAAQSHRLVVQTPQAAPSAALLQWWQHTIKQHANVAFSNIAEDPLALIWQAGELTMQVFDQTSQLAVSMRPHLSLPEGIDDVQATYQFDGIRHKLFVMLFSQQQLVAINAWDPVRAAWQNVVLGHSSAQVRGRVLSAVPLQQSYIALLMRDQASAAHVFIFNTITKQWFKHAVSLGTSDVWQSLIITNPMDPLHLLQWHPELQRFERYAIELSASQPVLGTMNWLVLLLYMLALIMIGLFYSSKQHLQGQFFLGMNSIPWWAAACSMYATMLSSLTYVALPAMVYQTNWLLLVGIWMLALVAPLCIYGVIPLYRHLKISTAYEYLARRFNHRMQRLASIIFILFQLGRCCVILALTALTLVAITPLSAVESVLLMGGLCLFYCALGGIQAVVWTDVLQTLVLLLGALLCFVVLLMRLDGGWSTFIDVGLADEKFFFADRQIDIAGLSELTLWVVVLGGIGQNVASYVADQSVVQRYLITPDLRSAERAMWANLAIVLPCTLLFFLNGTGLYVFYKTHPEKIDVTQQLDQIFPSFIVQELPIGIAGLIIAGIFAAAQSTISSSLNAMVHTLLVDVFRVKEVNLHRRRYRILLTLWIGVLVTCGGLWFLDPNIRSLMDTYFKIIGMGMGALAGVFLLGVLSPRANAFGAMVGLVAGSGVMVAAWYGQWLHGYLYATLGILTSVVVGYVASVLRPRPPYKDYYRLRAPRSDDRR